MAVYFFEIIFSYLIFADDVKGPYCSLCEYALTTVDQMLKVYYMLKYSEIIAKNMLKNMLKIC